MQAAQAVWPLRLPGDTRCVLDIMCENMTEHGYVYITVTHIAELLDIDKATVSRHVKRLVDAGVLSKEHDNQTSVKKYRIDLNRAFNCTIEKRNEILAKRDRKTLEANMKSNNMRMIQGGKS